ncbi:variable large family protein [Borrelia venezuelensis]|uniref:variable large family protein n=1 Tax=Borrelia venezuelensis TaxID=1653839 RepID=UPI001FF61AFD|nr:variable large family protein [Borrelia venezuelensis]UPA12771.1 variable large family protein [Borrelia venezuelensis]UPA12798.1 variable large family protein [Borrelia venezuelensis]UPA12849.1 variable large family protein [Borrelia venezuelensis]
MMKRITLSVLLMTLFLLLGCGSGSTKMEDPKTTFLNSLVKIGHGFQEIFGIFGNAIGDALGLTAVKSGDKRSKVGEHFEKIKKGLGDTKGKLKELSGDIFEAKNANSSTIEAVKSTISSASDVFEQLISALITLAGVTNDGADIVDTANAAAVAADKDSVETVIKEVKAIIETAKESGVKIDTGKAGSPVAAGDDKAGSALAKSGAAAAANSGPNLAEEVSKADPWAMIGKIKDAKIDAELAAGNNNEAGALATKIAAAGAKSNADLAAAVALKAMTKTGKLSAAANEDGAVKAAAITVVNKVLGILDIIIKRTVSSELDKIKKAVKGIQYSETTTESTEASAAQPTTPAVTK